MEIVDGSAGVHAARRIGARPSRGERRIAGVDPGERAADRFRLDDKTRRAVLESIRAELVGFKLPEPAADWARGFGTKD